MKKLNFKPIFWLIGIIVISMVIGFTGCPEEEGSSNEEGGGVTKILISIDVDYTQTTQYVVGSTTPFNKTDLTVTAKYADGSSAVVTNSPTCEVLGFSTTDAGSKSLTVVYTEGTTGFATGSFRVTISATDDGGNRLPTPVISASTYTSTSPISVTITCSDPGAAIYYTFGDGDPFAGTLYAGPFTISNVGTTKVTAGARKPGTPDSWATDKTFTIGNESTGKTISGLVIKTQPTKTTYTVGEPFDGSGMVLTLSYSDGSSVEKNSGYTTSSMPAEAGSKSITIRYQEGADSNAAIAILPITMVAGAKTLTDITLVSAPTKTTYESNEIISTVGMAITARFSDGSTDTNVADSCTINPTTAVATGNVTVTYVYNGGVPKTTSFGITVTAAQVNDLIVVPLPEARTYPDATGPITITLSTKAGATIWYTDDAAVENIVGGGIKYTGGTITVPFKELFTIRAVAVDNATNQPGTTDNFTYFLGLEEVFNPEAGTIVWYTIPSEYKVNGGYQTNWIRVVCSMGAGVNINAIYWSNEMFKKEQEEPTKYLFKIDYSIAKSTLAKCGWGLDGNEMPSYHDQGLLKIVPKGGTNVLGSYNLAAMAWDRKAGFDPFTHSGADGVNNHKPRAGNTWNGTQVTEAMVTGTYWAQYIGIEVKGNIFTGSPPNMAWNIPDDAGIVFQNTSDHKVNFNQFSLNGQITSN